MNLSTYQERALQTDQVPRRKGDIGGPAESARNVADIQDASLIVPLLGLVGEAGGLLSEYKKYLRDGDAHRLFKDRVAEELGDLLWYLANVASKFGLNLEDIANSNLTKVQNRWSTRQRAAPRNFDVGFPEHERLPRQMVVDITEQIVDGVPRMRAQVNGEQIGDDLTDNSYDHDGYRFHDIFHFAYAAVLGWSPVVRANLKRKRKSVPRIDEVEDGGRAAAIEEGVSAIVFDYAKHHAFLDGISAVDSEILRTVKSVTSYLEVAVCSVGDWERAILQGFAVWREIMNHRGGAVTVDLDAGTITYAAHAS
jgi:NTP pyrophosphatase (non-canonical NTP hydrolase)